MELLSRDLKNAKARQRARLKRTTNNIQALEIDSVLYVLNKNLIEVRNRVLALEGLENREKIQRKKLNNSHGRNFLGETYGV